MRKAPQAVLIGAGCAIALCAAVATWTPAQSPSPSPSVMHVPVASFDPPEPATPAEAATRQTLSEHFKWYGARLKGNELGDPRISIHHDVLDDKALVDKGDAIFRGTVEAAAAYLTQGRETIYCELRVRVSAVFKDNALVRVPPRLQPGTVVTVVREGGAVQLPNGRVVQQLFARQRLPAIDGQYILFVKRLPEAQAFAIITGYSVKDAEVEPLDLDYWFPRYQGPLGPFEQRILALTAPGAP